MNCQVTVGWDSTNAGSSQSGRSPGLKRGLRSISSISSSQQNIISSSLSLSRVSRTLRTFGRESPVTTSSRHPTLPIYNLSWTLCICLRLAYKPYTPGPCLNLMEYIPSLLGWIRTRLSPVIRHFTTGSMILSIYPLIIYRRYGWWHFRIRIHFQQILAATEWLENPGSCLLVWLQRGNHCKTHCILQLLATSQARSNIFASPCMGRGPYEHPFCLL